MEGVGTKGGVSEGGEGGREGLGEGRGREGGGREEAGVWRDRERDE